MRNFLLLIRSYIGFIYKSLYSYISTILIGKKSKMILIDNEKHLFLVDKKDLGVGLCLRKSGNYNPDEYYELLNHVNKNSVVLVLGPHIGAHIIPLSEGGTHELSNLRWLSPGENIDSYHAHVKNQKESENNETNTI